MSLFSKKRKKRKFLSCLSLVAAQVDSFFSLPQVSSIIQIMPCAWCTRLLCTRLLSGAFLFHAISCSCLKRRRALSFGLQLQSSRRCNSARHRLLVSTHSPSAPRCSSSSLGITHGRPFLASFLQQADTLSPSPFPCGQCPQVLGQTRPSP